jgi:hypothetical protein
LIEQKHISGIFCSYLLVTLIPEPTDDSNIVENGVNTNKKERLDSSDNNSNLLTSEKSTTPPSAKKGNDKNLFFFKLT